MDEDTKNMAIVLTCSSLLVIICLISAIGLFSDYQEAQKPTPTPFNPKVYCESEGVPFPSAPAFNPNQHPHPVKVYVEEEGKYMGVGTYADDSIEWSSGSIEETTIVACASIVSAPWVVTCDYSDDKTVKHYRARYKLTLFAVRTGEVITSTFLELQPKVLKEDECPFFRQFWNETHIKEIPEFPRETIIEFITPYAGITSP